MIISEKQIIQLLCQIKDHIDLLVRINYTGDYKNYLIDLHDQIMNQQPEELKLIE